MPPSASKFPISQQWQHWKLNVSTCYFKWLPVSPHGSKLGRVQLFLILTHSYFFYWLRRRFIQKTLPYLSPWIVILLLLSKITWCRLIMHLNTLKASFSTYKQVGLEGVKWWMVCHPHRPQSATHYFSISYFRVHFWTEWSSLAGHEGQNHSLCSQHLPPGPNGCNPVCCTADKQGHTCKSPMPTGVDGSTSLANKTQKWECTRRQESPLHKLICLISQVNVKSPVHCFWRYWCNTRHINKLF